MAFSTSGSSILETTSKLLSGIGGLDGAWESELSGSPWANPNPQYGAAAQADGVDAADRLGNRSGGHGQASASAGSSTTGVAFGNGLLRVQGRQHTPRDLFDHLLHGGVERYRHGGAHLLGIHNRHERR